MQKGSHLLIHRAIVEEGLDSSSSFWASLRSCPMDPRIRQDITNWYVYDTLAWYLRVVTHLLIALGGRSKLAWIIFKDSECDLSTSR